MATENGAKGMSRQDAADEKDSLEKQVAADTDFIAATQKSLAEKKEQWKVRQELRTGELAAISKAIQILHNDDARDLFKRSFASQAPGEFLQVGQTSKKALLTRKAVDTIREVARRSGDSRLYSLARIAEDPEKIESV